CSATDRIGAVGAVNADALFVERYPHHTDWVARPRRKQMKIAASPAVLKHFLIPPESRHLRDAAYFPFTDRRGRMRGANCDGIRGDELVSFKYPKHVRFAVDLYGYRRLCGFAFLHLFVLVCTFTLCVGLIFNVVCGLSIAVATWLDLLHRSELKWFDVGNRELIAGFDCFHFAWIKLLQQMHIAVELLGDGVG